MSDGAVIVPSRDGVSSILDTFDILSPHSASLQGPVYITVEWQDGFSFLPLKQWGMQELH